MCKRMIVSVRLSGLESKSGIDANISIPGKRMLSFLQILPHG